MAQEPAGPMLRCEECRQEYPSYDSIHLASDDGGKARELCRNCFNRYMAEALDVDFDPGAFVPYTVQGPDQRVHVFQFRSMLCPTGRLLEAFELVDGRPGGYQFKVIGDFDEDAFALCGQLVERIRRRVGKLDLEDHDGHLILPHGRPTRGRIDYSPDEDMPVVVIDGRVMTWRQFGEMWRSYEGWQFRVEMVDPTEEA